MKTWIHCGVAAVALAFAAEAPGFDDTFRCGLDRIKVGDSEREMLDACGRPDSRSSSFENIRDASGKRRSARVVNYVYENRDRHSTVYVWVIEGEIIRISSR